MFIRRDVVVDGASGFPFSGSGEERPARGGESEGESGASRGAEEIAAVATWMPPRLEMGASRLRHGLEDGGTEPAAHEKAPARAKPDRGESVEA